MHNLLRGSFVCDAGKYSGFPLWFSHVFGSGIDVNRAGVPPEGTAD
jgi:hypothetical protein